MEINSDEELRELEMAVAAYKSNRNNKTNQWAGQKSKTKSGLLRNSTPEPQNKSGPEKVKFTESLLGSDSTDLQDLIRYFISPIHVDKIPHKKEIIDYEKQGAKPKTRTNQLHQRNQAKNVPKQPFRHKYKNIPDVIENTFNYNSKIHTETGNTVDEDIYSKPFFYIVPENPSTNFLLPRGSYYVIPRAPDPFSSEKIVIHPEWSSASSRQSQSSPPVIYDQKSGEGKGEQAENLNDLGKSAPQRADSHLNIGPAQEKERCTISNLESNCKWNKIYDKSINTRPETSAETLDEYHQMVFTVRERLMLEFPDISSSVAGDIAENYYLDKEGLEDYIATRRKDLKIQEQFNRMLKALPESVPEDLLEKSLEFQGDVEKETAYVEEVTLRNRRQQLVTEMMMIVPDANPNFLLESAERFLDDPSGVNDFTLNLLESQDYPKISENGRAAHRELWQRYVENFDVDSYLLRVPDPEAFAGPAGDHNKADMKLIMRFLTTRYPDASEAYLSQEFDFYRKNLTTTCENLNRQEAAVRLSESGFEYEDFTENFLREACYIDRREEIDERVKWVKEMKEIEAAEARLDQAFLSCPLCGEDELLASEAVTCPEGDLFCRNCIKMYVKVKIGNGIYKFACPSEGCASFFTISTLEHLLPETVLSKAIQKQQVEELVTAKVDGLEFCPSCDFAYIPNPSDKLFKCLNPLCMLEICRNCKEKNHIPLRCEEVEKPADVEARKKIEEAMTEKLVRKCPSCGKRIVKIDGCNKVICSCGSILCYVCRRKISGYEHFRSDGCPLHTNNTVLHEDEVKQEGIRVREQILQENPNIRIFNDPTEDVVNQRRSGL